MDEAALQKVLRFSEHLRNFTDVLFGQNGVVSVDSWTLYEIEKAFSLIIEAEQLTDFHVLPPNHRQHPAIPQIQFLYDILQKIKKLKILIIPGRTLPKEQHITLKCFRNLHSLELNSIPIHQLKGLQNLRPILKSLTAHNVCACLEDILGKCGADQSTEYSWENLKIAIFSGNPFKTIDDSVHLLKSIKVLDLSYCELVNASALFCLPIVSKLDLSYNKLTTVPLLSETASNSLIALDLGNNMIIDMNGIEKFQNIEELDLKENFICLEVTLIHLSCLSKLKYLNMMKNPVTCGINYRVHTLRCLHSNTKFYQEFIFDNAPLEYEERKVIGTQLELVEPVNNGVRLLRFLTEKVTELLRAPNAQEPLSVNRTIAECNEASLVESVEVNLHLSQSFNWQKYHSGYGRFQKFETPSTAEPKRKKSRKNRTRHVSIAEPEPPKENYIDTSNVPRRLFSTPSNSENVDVNNDVRCPLSSEKVGEGHSTDIENDTSNLKEPLQSDKLLEEILHSQEMSYNEDSHPEIKFPSNIDPINISVMDSSMISSTSSICKAGESYSFQSSTRLSPIHTDDEDMEPDKENYTILGKWENKLIDKNVPVDSEYALLSFSSYYYKEKHTLSHATMVKMCISSLISMELLCDKPLKIQFRFGHSNPELSTRVFTFEDDQFEKIKGIVQPIIQNNLLNKELMKPPLLCKKCGFLFKGLMAPVAGGPFCNDDYCKYCGNYIKNMNIQSPNGEIETSLYSTPPCGFADSNCESGKDHSENSADRHVQNHKRQKSNAQSSDSSESFSVCSSEVSQVKHESDLEIISNPSISSIEVLADQQADSHSDIPCCEAPVSAVMNSDARTPPPEHEFKMENKLVANSKQDSTLMQESSSSGSMTGSVCTAVDRLSSGPNTPMKNRDESVKSVHIQDNLDESMQISSSQLIPASSDNADGPCNSSETKLLSSSSKSTDTVCHQPRTIKQALAQLPLYDAARKGIILTDTPENYKLENWLPELLKGYTGYNWLWWNEFFCRVFNPLPVPKNQISYSYQDFSQVDHRLELYAEVFLFSEDDERLTGLVKAHIVIEGEDPFIGLVIISNCSVYALMITNEENGSPQTWLDEKFSTKLQSLECIYTLINGQGVSLRFKEKHVLICLADSLLSSEFFTFVTDIYKDRSLDFKIEEHSQYQETQLIEVITALNHLPEENEFKNFQVVSLMEDNGSTLHRFLLLTSSYLFLFEANLTWLLPVISSDKRPHLKLCESYRIDDITKMNVLSDTIFQIHFYSDGEHPPKEPLMVHVTSSEALCRIIYTVRSLWIQIFKVEFDIISESSEFLIVKEILKDSVFADYLK